MSGGRQHSTAADPPVWRGVPHSAPALVGLCCHIWSDTGLTGLLMMPGQAPFVPLSVCCIVPGCPRNCCAVRKQKLAGEVQVHAYLAVPGGRTAYLSELKSGSEVLVVDPQGCQRAAVVGRIKVEQRPLVSQPRDAVPV